MSIIAAALYSLAEGLKLSNATSFNYEKCVAD
jgi:hypothetical protein